MTLNEITGFESSLLSAYTLLSRGSDDKSLLSCPSDFELHWLSSKQEGMILKRAFKSVLMELSFWPLPPHQEAFTHTHWHSLTWVMEQHQVTPEGEAHQSDPQLEWSGQAQPSLGQPTPRSPTDPCGSRLLFQTIAFFSGSYIAVAYWLKGILHYPLASYLPSSALVSSQLRNQHDLLKYKSDHSLLCSKYTVITMPFKALHSVSDLIFSSAFSELFCRDPGLFHSSSSMLAFSIDHLYQNTAVLFF